MSNQSIGAEQLLRTLGIHYIREGHHHSREGWLQLHCPYCARSNYHLGLNIQGNYFNCWRCGKLPLINTLLKISRQDFKTIKALVSDLPTALPGKRIKRTGTLRIPSGILPLEDCPKHRRYLRRRGIDWEYLRDEWGVGGIGQHSKYGWRLFIPITLDNEVVSFTTRAIVDGDLRYLSASEDEEAISHKDILFGEDKCYHSIAIVEGPFDAFRIGAGATAQLGLAWTPSQLTRMTRYQRRIVCFDAEEGAQKRAQRLCRLLAPFDGETFNVVLDSKDPGEAGKKEVKEIRKLLKG